MTATNEKYNIGGVRWDRPFKIRRLGHFGYNSMNPEAAVKFYTEMLGFRISDPWPNGGAFMRYGSDHHAMVIFDKKSGDERAQAGPNAHHFRYENDINQITWQVQSLSEVWNATKYFRDLEHPIRTEGRAGTGSNFHLYVWDPDEQIDELYYGIEQVGWDGHAKPRTMYHGMREASFEPHIPEAQEVDEDLEKGMDLMRGYRYISTVPYTHDVDGVLLGQPFKIVRIGPVHNFCDDVEAAREYYNEVMGFKLSETVNYNGHTCYFLRADNEHHAMGLFPKALRSELGLKEDTSNMAFGIQLANYRQLKDAIAFLRENGVRVETGMIPQELHPGIDYAAYAFDPDGHALMLYFQMEQIGWQGEARPAELRAKVDPNNWPDELEPTADTFNGEPYLGPWA